MARQNQLRATARVPGRLRRHPRREVPPGRDGPRADGRGVRRRAEPGRPVPRQCRRHARSRWPSRSVTRTATPRDPRRIHVHPRLRRHGEASSGSGGTSGRRHRRPDPISADLPPTQTAAGPHGRGQNVLYAGGSVRYTTATAVNGDDIYVNDAGLHRAGFHVRDASLGSPRTTRNDPEPHCLPTLATAD